VLLIVDNWQINGQKIAEEVVTLIEDGRAEVVGE
jgi:hypothetical protein